MIKKVVLIAAILFTYNTLWAVERNVDVILESDGSRGSSDWDDLSDLGVFEEPSAFEADEEPEPKPAPKPKPRPKPSAPKPTPKPSPKPAAPSPQLEETPRQEPVSIPVSAPKEVAEDTNKPEGKSVTFGELDPIPFITPLPGTFSETPAVRLPGDYRITEKTDSPAAIVPGITEDIKKPEFPVSKKMIIYAASGLLLLLITGGAAALLIKYKSKSKKEVKEDDEVYDPAAFLKELNAINNGHQNQTAEFDEKKLDEKKLDNIEDILHNIDFSGSDYAEIYKLLLKGREVPDIEQNTDFARSEIELVVNILRKEGKVI